MAGDNRLVTENFLRLNFTPKSGINPGTNDLISMDCNQILARYNVSVTGITTTGTRCPGQNQISGLVAPTISASNITRSSVSVYVAWNSFPEFLTHIGFVLFRHTNAILSDTPAADEWVSLDAQPLNTYRSRSGSFHSPVLIPNTIYYTRAVYRTATGDYYGPEISFTTLP